jgi:hypothetical protein
MRMNPIRTIEFSDGSKLDIYQDEVEESPRDWDNLGTMVCLHKRYHLGDKHDYRSSSFSGWEELKEQIINDHNPAVILPLYMMDHSGLSIKASSGTFRAIDSAGWDWGQIGYIFVSREKLLKEFGKKRISKKLRDKAEACLLAEVKTYDRYVSGDVYYYNLTDASGKDIDSCGGFFGAESIAHYLPEQYQKEFFVQL